MCRSVLFHATETHASQTQNGARNGEWVLNSVAPWMAFFFSYHFTGRDHRVPVPADWMVHLFVGALRSVGPCYSWSIHVLVCKHGEACPPPVACLLSWRGTTHVDETRCSCAPENGFAYRLSLPRQLLHIGKAL